MSHTFADRLDDELHLLAAVLEADGVTVPTGLVNASRRAGELLTKEVPRNAVEKQAFYQEVVREYDTLHNDLETIDGMFRAALDSGRGTIRSTGHDEAMLLLKQLRADADRFLQARGPVRSNRSEAGRSPKSANDNRDQWIYRECCKGTPLSMIVQKLTKKPKSWYRINTPTGIRNAANRYADRHGRPRPQRRKK